MRRTRASKYDGSVYSKATQQTIEKDGSYVVGQAARDLAAGLDVEAFFDRHQVPVRRRPRILRAATELARRNHGYSN